MINYFLDSSALLKRYYSEQGAAWVKQISQMGPTMHRIKVRPEWVGILDFQTRFPSAIEKAMADA